ncbi:polyamine-transporting ATPase 13A3-like [Glandiceps talaboti]
MSSDEDKASGMAGVAYQRTQSMRATINEGDDDEIDCISYKDDMLKTVFIWIGTIFTLGGLWLVFYWRPDWKVKCMTSRCALADATWVVIKDVYTRDHVSRVETVRIDERSELKTAILDILKKDVFMNGCQLRFFKYQKLKYIWDPADDVFRKLKALDEGTQFSELHDNYPGLTVDQQKKRRYLYGENVILVQVRSYFVLFIQEVLHPFYVFQLFSVCLWLSDEYYYYAACIIIMSSGSIGISLYTTRKQSVMLRDMVKSSHEVGITRGNGDVEMIAEDELVPGDVLVIPPNGCPMTCDAVLLTGNCIVNESMLTGESVPVTKIPLPNSESERSNYYNPDEHKRHTLFCGTQVIQTRYYGSEKVKAVVVRTGYNTAKGTLVRAILYPKPMDIKLYKDGIKFVLVLLCMAVLGFIYTVIILALQEVTVSDIVLKSLDIITIAIPPALPAALTIGIVYAQTRLRKQNIYCISPTRINLCGTMDVVCFDKTGTLTEDGLDLMGVVPVNYARFDPMETEAWQLPINNLLISMTTCHSLTRIQGELSGDPLDLKMFEATKWTLHEPTTVESTNFDMLMPTIVKPPGAVQNVNEGRATVDGQPQGLEVGIVRQLPFSSGLQRMSVVTRTLGADHMMVYVKGAPEKILSLCSVKTIPDNFENVLHGYTSQGFRVIAMASKPLDPSIQWHKVLKMNRDDIECDLEFCGLLVMQNMLKPETSPVIRELNTACIRIVMVTGDNMLTAVSVARKCGILKSHHDVIMVEAYPPGDELENIKWRYADKLETNTDVVDPDLDPKKESLNAIIVRMDDSTSSNYHFAVDGKSFGVIREHYPYLLPKIAVRGTVFARMLPHQKAHLVEALQQLDYSVGMCGDGANDTGALKAAHAGISLSEAEASVASPFTSKTPNITCVPIVIREGRAALVTSFSMFKYMALYSMIQFVSVMILYSIQSNLGDIMFLYIDICIITVVAILMGRSEAYRKIVTRKPPTQLMTTPILASLILQVIVQTLVQTAAFLTIKAQSWFTPLVPNEEDYYENIVCYETTTIFLVSVFQYLIVAAAFSTGKPYTKPIYRNYLYTGALTILVIFSIIIVMLPDENFGSFFELKQYPKYYFRGVILAIALVNMVLSFLIEFGIIPRTWLKYILECKFCRTTQPSKKFKSLEIELNGNPDWPPVEGTVQGTTHDEACSTGSDSSKKELMKDVTENSALQTKGEESTQF